MQTFANIKAQNTVISMLKSLSDKNLILKREYMKDNVRRVAYRANLEYIDKMKKGIVDAQPNNHTE